MRHSLSAAAAGLLLTTPALRAFVPVEQIEAPLDQQGYQYAPVFFNGQPSITLQPGDQGGGFDYLTFYADAAISTTANNLSTHARGVGLGFYGTGTPGYAFIRSIYCQSADTFLQNVQTTGSLGSGPLPGTFLGGAKIINASWVYTYAADNYPNYPQADTDALRRIDYMINAADVTYVAAAVSQVLGSYNLNTSTPAYNDLTWSSYNSLAVAGTNSNTEYFDPSSSPGKGHADVFVPGEASSSAGVASGYAATLFGTAQAAGQADAQHGVVIRSLIMTGADKTSGGVNVYSRQTTSGLSLTFGAGQADLNTSLAILQGGEKPVATANTSGGIAASATAATTQYGWSESTSILNGRQVVLIHVDNAITGVTASLNWNVTSNTSGGSINTSLPIFANLALELRTVTGSAGSYVLGPAQTDPNLKAASTVDNVEYLYSTGTLPAGNYALLVTGDTTKTAMYGLSYALSGSFATRWNTSAGGSWGTPTNWSNGIPNGAGAQANFLASPGITTPSTITLDGNRIVGQMTFNNSNGYTITPGTGGTLTINDTGDSSGIANPLITIATGSHTIGVPISLAGGLTINASSGASLAITGSFGGAAGFTKTGGGTLSVASINSITGGTITVNGGTLNLLAPAALFQQNAVAAINVASGAVVTLASPTSTAARQVLITTGGLTLNGTAKLDLTGNDLVIPNGNLATVTSQIKTGYNLAGGGTWTGTGITSSTAGADATHTTAVGVIANTAGAFNSTNPFDGYTAATTDVLVRYTYFGDANLDGKVDGSDYALIDNGYLNHWTGWQNGDFNYDGTVNAGDYTLIDNAFNRQAAKLSPTALIATPSASTSPVPEPATAAWGLSIAALGRRRRRPST